MSATTIDKFISECDVIVAAKPEYANGCANTKKCDCIGMVKYGLHENGVSFSTTGTNWTYRNQVDCIREILCAEDLERGDVVFKMKKPTDSGYNLPAKYRPGGSAFNGDLNDYCHIGVVKSVSPLRIIHMTSPTAKTDTSIGKWKMAAHLKDKYISDYGTQPVPEPVPVPEPTEETAIVYAESGKWVKMRKEPSVKCRLYEEVPIGATVTVEEFGNEWTKISYGRRKGWYMMTKFLIMG